MRFSERRLSMNVLLCTPTSVSVELCNGDAYCTEPFEVYLDDVF